MSNAVSFTLTCPRCGHDVEAVNGDRKGFVSRERRLVVECQGPACRWGGVVHVELVDLTHRKAS